MVSNGHVGQVLGPFTIGQDLLSPTGPIGQIIKQESPVLYKIGIQATSGTIVAINGTNIKIGLTGVYELEDVIKIKSIAFQTATDENAQVDFIYPGTIVY